MAVGPFVRVSGAVETRGETMSASAPAQAVVGAASAQVLAANPDRKGLALVNVSANRISLGFGSDAVLDRGITLYGNGGSFLMTDRSVTTQAVSAIASAPDSALAIQEFA